MGRRVLQNDHIFSLLNISAYMLDINSCAASLVDNLAGTSHTVAMRRTLICSHCFLSEQHYKNKKWHTLKKNVIN